VDLTPGRDAPNEGQSNAETDAEDRIALRDLLVWFGGSLLGGMGGFQFGALLEANLIRLAAGVVGWLGGGMLAILLVSRIGRSGRVGWLGTGPTLPVRTASWMVIGFLVGCLLGGLAGSIVLDQLAGPRGVRPWSEGIATLIGGLVGFVLGGILGPLMSRRGIQQEKGVSPAEDPPTDPSSTSGRR
jgi:hypothetical protein